jgi:hypothetical protein
LLREDTDLEGLRGDPRFAAVMARFEAPLPDEYHQLDFWVGPWEARDGERPLGSYEIEKAENGHLIVERWVGAAGPSWRGMMFFDPAARKWRIARVSSTGEILRGVGTPAEGGMVFEGDRTEGKARQQFRLKLSSSGENRARSLLEAGPDNAGLKPLSDLALWRRSEASEARPAREPAAPPSELAQLDFWIGDWEVRTSDGRAIGEDRIMRREGGFLLMETWVSALHQTGRSMTFFDPADQLWRQVWVDDAGFISQLEGAFSDGALRWQGVASARDGRTQTLRSTLTPEKPDRLRHVSELSEDGGATWKPRFDFTHERISSRRAPAGD